MIEELKRELEEINEALSAEYKKMAKDDEYNERTAIRKGNHDNLDTSNFLGSSAERMARRELESKNFQFAEKAKSDRIRMLIDRKNELLQQIEALQQGHNAKQDVSKSYGRTIGHEVKTGEEIIPNDAKSKVDLKSPINGSPLEQKGDGLFYSEHDDLFYTVDGSGTVIPIKSPINGSRLEPKGDGLFYSENDDLFYTVDGTGAITPMKSPINGSRLEPKGDGLFYSENDDLFYTVDGTGAITPMKSPINGSRLEPKGDGTFYSEHDDSLYTVDENGTITLMKSRDDETNLGTVSDNISHIDNIDNIENATSSIKSHEIQEETRAVKTAVLEEQKSMDGTDIIQSERD